MATGIKINAVTDMSWFGMKKVGRIRMSGFYSQMFQLCHDDMCLLSWNFHGDVHRSWLYC